MGVTMLVGRSGTTVRCRFATCVRVTAVAVLAGCGGGGATDPSPPPPPSPVAQTATVSGNVTLVGAATPLAGAAVRIGTLAGTSDASGRYAIANVPVGAGVQIRVSLADFDDYTATITVPSEGVRHDVPMRRRTVFQAGAASAYLPDVTGPMRGIVVVLFGGTARGVADGNTSTGNPAFDPDVQVMREFLLSFARTDRLVILGLDVPPAGTAPTSVRSALATLASQTGRPELTQVPWFVFGASAGAPRAWEVVEAEAARIIGFWLNIPIAPGSSPLAASLAIPGFVMLAERDEPALNTGATTFWTAGRSGGARWGIAVERNQTHRPLSDRGLAFFTGWLRTVLDRRLPLPGASGTLVNVAESSGWLGDRSSFAVAPFAAYPGGAASASWLPSQAAAEAWRAFSIGSTSAP
jgi:hypothetical protein